MGVIPGGGDNAVVRVAFVLEFTRDRDKELIGRVAALASEMVERGFSGSAVESIEFSLPSGSGSESVRRNWLAGHQFSRKSSGSPVSEIVLRDKSLIITVDTYSRWRHVWGEVRNFFSLLLPLFHSSENPLQAVALEYLDKFISREEKFPTNEVLSSSQLLPPKCLDADSHWHSNNGFISTSGVGQFANRLDLLNVSVLEESKKQVLKIVTQHKYIRPLSGIEDLQSTIMECFQNAHDINKNTLRDLLTEDARKLISLGDAK